MNFTVHIAQDNDVFASIVAAVGAVATVIAAVATSFAAFAAWRSTKASAQMLDEARRTRAQSVEPYLSISFPNPYFSIAWRPQTGQPPMTDAGWAGFTYGVVGGFEPPGFMISNYGGGPALNLRISVIALDTDATAPPTVFTDAGGAIGATLHWSGTALGASTTANAPGPGWLTIRREVADFAPSCARDAPISFELPSDLLLRLLPTTMLLEREGYFPAGTPSNRGRVGWRVQIAYRTAEGGDDKEFHRDFFAERVRIDTVPGGADAAWMEKLYRCELSVTPTDGFEVTPRPVTVNARATLAGHGELHAFATVVGPAAD